MFEFSNDGLAEDVDTIRQGDGSFSAYPGNNVTFRRTRARDNFCGDQWGRGAPLSNSLVWAGSPDSSGLKIEDSHYYNLCNPGNLVWDRSTFTVIEVSSADFQLRSPIVNSFAWEVGVNAGFTYSTSGLTVNFSDKSISNGGTVNGWFWEFGDGGIATTANPSHTYSAAGTYTVSLTVSDSQGASDFTAQSITLIVNDPNQPPTAEFTSSAQDLNVNFNDVSTDSDGTISSRSWNFGDGGFSTSTNPSHTYAAAGIYTVSLTVIDNDGAMGSLSKNITLTVSDANQAPIAGFTSSSSGLTANFTDASTDGDGTIATWSWNFGDGGTSTLINPSHTYSSSGIYTANLTITDNDGASNSFSQSVTVIDPNQALEAPTNLTASSERNGKGKNKTKTITLSWKDNSDNETGFVIERCQENGKSKCSFYEWTILPALTVSYQFESTSSYRYRVKARKDDVDSMPSNDVKG